MTKHCAWREQDPDETWKGGCWTCGTGFSGAEQLGAESWCSGHDSAVACANWYIEVVLLPELWHQWEIAHHDHCCALVNGQCPKKGQQLPNDCQWPIPGPLQEPLVRNEEVT